MSRILFTGGGASSQGGSGPGGVLVWGGACSRGVGVPGTGELSAPGGCLVDTLRTATAADGTHSTGMHSCFAFKFSISF